MRVRGGVGSGVCFSLIMVSTCFWRGRLCFGKTRDRGFVLYVSVFLRVLGWVVCVCLYTRVHTHKLLGYLMWAQVWDGHLESRKNPDRLKRSIHVDCIGVHSTFVYIYAGLRALMIWANCLFSFNMSYFLRKVEDVTRISKSQSLTSVSIKDCTLRVPNETTTLFLLRVIIKAIVIHKLVSCQNQYVKACMAWIQDLSYPITPHQVDTHTLSPENSLLEHPQKWVLSFETGTISHSVYSPLHTLVSRQNSLMLLLLLLKK